MYDIGIIGAGIAGTSLATALADGGFNVVLLERNWDCEEGIIGELLQPGGVQKLKELGLSHVLSEIEAQPIEGYAMFLNEQWLEMGYPKQKSATLSGYGFRYHKLVSKLRKICMEHPKIDCMHGNALSLIEDQDKVKGFRCKTADGNEVEVLANLTVISQGLLKSFGKAFNNSEIKVEGHMLGMILKDVNLPYVNHGHVILTDRSPILVYPVGRGESRVLIDFDKDMPSMKGNDLKNHLLNKLNPQMPPGLQEAFKRATLEGNYKTRAACNLSSRPVLKSGVVMLGDNLNMRHPITGGGMTVALTDVKLLSDLIIKSKGKVNDKQLLKTFYTKRHEHNATINILADALYHVFRHNILKVACFEYLKQGGKYSSEPMAILSGISRNRWLLYRHFFAVAGYASKKMSNLGFESNYGMGQFRVLKDATNILYPRILAELPKTFSKKSIKKNLKNKEPKSKQSYEYKKDHKEPQRAST